MTTVNHIRTGSIVTGPTLPEPVEVLVTMPMGTALKIIGRGRNTGMTYDPVLTPEQIARLQVSAEREPFDGAARLFRLGIKAKGVAPAGDTLRAMLPSGPTLILMDEVTNYVSRSRKMACATSSSTSYRTCPRRPGHGRTWSCASRFPRRNWR